MRLFGIALTNIAPMVALALLTALPASAATAGQLPNHNETVVRLSEG